MGLTPWGVESLWSPVSLVGGWGAGSGEAPEPEGPGARGSDPTSLAAG